jgi:hypothetical protein
MGSRLAAADGREIWGLGAGSVVRALGTFGGSLRDLALPSDVGDGPARDGVVPCGFMPSWHVVPGVWSPAPGNGSVHFWFSVSTLHEADFPFAPASSRRVDVIVR